MNIGALLVLFKFLKDAGVVSPLVIGPPAPDIPVPTDPGAVPSSCIRPDGKLTWGCYLKYIDSSGSLNDYEDYLKGR